MKFNTMKILAITVISLLISAGVSLADDDCKYSRGHAYGHYKEKVHHNYAPKPVYVEHHYYPVVVERDVYHQPVRYVAPAPEGFFFGMSVFDAGTAFSFGVSG